MKKLKTKILSGLTFLLALIMLLSITGIISVYYLSEDSKSIIQDNYASVDYSFRMINLFGEMFLLHKDLLNKNQRDYGLQYLDDREISLRKDFEKYLDSQSKNITEPGEKDLVSDLRKYYSDYLRVIRTESYVLQSSIDEKELRIRYEIVIRTLISIYDLNLKAILEKNKTAGNTADKATFYMGVTALVSLILTLVFLVYFPNYIVRPLNELTQKINEISHKKYDQRISPQKDYELDMLAESFNKMAYLLKEYEEKHIDDLLSEKGRTEALVSNLQDGVALVDNNFKIVMSNKRFSELVECGVDSLSQRSIFTLKPENVFIKHIANVINLPRPDFYYHSEKPFKIILNKSEEYYQIVIIDIIKTKNETLGNERNDSIILIKNVTSSEERNIAKTNLLATVSHELKTPLSAINIAVKLLEDFRVGQLNNEQSELVESIKLQGQRLLNLINEVMDYAQVETGHVKLKIISNDISDIIELSVFAVLILFNEKEIEPEIRIHENLPKVKCDLEKTVWVLVNLLSNAVRYSPIKGKILIKADLNSPYITISVCDEGPGIKDDEKEKIFMKYAKAKDDKVKGTGLGLAIAKEFVEVQGGEIWVESVIGKGSTFCFSIPAV